MARSKKSQKIENTMVQKSVVMAEHAKKLWMVYIQSPKGFKDNKFYFREPLKAMRYMFVLRNKHGVDISENALAKLQMEHNNIKNNMI